ncbi:tRNA A-37 threonylcarbamoyl transferase component Bud32 [Microbacterium trichothecenolyticum]|uniref:protein kinase domain-containing protein n=1 Tax=Microbacterium trichothecenolyticum TaxID=69370 RepID=UPI0028591011|nr:protein kinase [Microbacterium trichothecenolyticum]MDR7186899.1 tRNA A-37 threonylcarbamoyl transferase component Bud32 [Microbacterium trichothecenolyticum]
MTDLLASGELSTGELLDDRYLLRERIGEGGMARVYRADDTHLQRSVAVKVFREPTDGVSSVERALSETTLLASLSHHSLVTVFDARVGTDEVSYLVMEHVDGITLRDLIARGPVDPRIVASIAIDIAEGLHVAHDHGVVHRDIKPSNVLLWSSPRPGWEWRAKLADFGIAYLMDSARVTTPGVIVGTMAYVAPEQARGVVPAPPADIYAFGLLLIEALTGERPFGDAEGIGTVMARLSSAPKIPESLHPSWQGLLRGMTAIRPDDRPTSLEIVATASRLAAMENTLARENADPSTAPIAAPVATPVTGPTQVFPQPTPSSPPVAPGALRRDARVSALSLGTYAGTDAAAAPVLPLVPDEERRPSRRALVIGAVLAAVLAVGLALGTLWLANSWTAEPEPAPTSPVAQVPPAPTEDAPVEEAPADAPADQAPAEQVPPADTGGGGGANSGPGNNNGNGNGPGSNSGKGNGNGNR